MNRIIVLKSWRNYRCVSSCLSDLEDSSGVSSLHEGVVSTRYVDVSCDTVCSLSSIHISVYLSYPSSLPLNNLSSYLLTAFTAIDSLMHHYSMIPSCRRGFVMLDIVMYYQLSNEVIDIINKNNYSSLLNTIATLFHYTVGFTMRDMSLSLMNRPFLKLSDNASDSVMMMESRRVDTQTVIDERTPFCNYQFQVYQ